MALEGEDWFDNQYYANHRRLLTIIGLWPHVRSSKRLLSISLTTVLLVVAIYFQIYKMFTLELQVGSIIEVLQTFLPSVLFAVAYWNLLYNFDLMKEALECVKTNWNEISCKDELSIMQKYAAQNKLYSQIIAYLFYFYISFLIFPSISRLFQYIFGEVQVTELILPVHDDFFLSTTQLYLIMFVIELLCILVICTIGITVYSTFLSFIQHACALLIFVTHKIDRPFIKDEYKFCRSQTGSKREAELQWIVAIVKNYNNAVKFIELIRALYGKMSILETILGLCFISMDFIYFFQLLNLVSSVEEILKICFYLNGTLLVIFAYSHLGERLIEHSISVYSKCLFVPFYTLSIQTNKLLMMLLIRSMKPCNLSVMGRVTVSHELLAKMMKASFSFATVCYKLG